MILFSTPASPGFCSGASDLVLREHGVVRTGDYKVHICAQLCDVETVCKAERQGAVSSHITKTRDIFLGRELTKHTGEGEAVGSCRIIEHKHSR